MRLGFSFRVYCSSVHVLIGDLFGLSPTSLDRGDDIGMWCQSRMNEPHCNSVIARTDALELSAWHHCSCLFRLSIPRSRSLAILPFPIPTHCSIMISDGRSRRRELVEEAYNLQVKAGLMASRIFLLAWLNYRIITLLFDLSHSHSVSAAVTYYHLSFFSFFFISCQSIHIHIIKKTLTARGTIWCIWPRLCDSRPPYLAHLPVSF